MALRDYLSDDAVVLNLPSFKKTRQLTSSVQTKIREQRTTAPPSATSVH